MTRQKMEKLIDNGEKTFIINYGFYPNLPQDKSIFQKTNRGMSLSCGRGYVATWEIQDDIFYLKDIEGRYLLRDKKSVYADWFSNIIRVYIPQTRSKNNIVKS